MPRVRTKPKSGKTLYETLDETVAAIHLSGLAGADVGVIFGTGLGVDFSDLFSIEGRLSYGAIPHLPRPSVEGHAGQLVWGKCGQGQVAVFEGRVHCYEGYSAAEVAYAVRVLARLGAKTVILTNIAGGLNPNLQEGDLLLISDHINLMGVNPLVGPNDERIGQRFPDMIEPYSRRLLSLARSAGKEAGIALREGVYVGVLGPNLETKAEYRFLRMIGADVVGMSTIPEVVAAVHAGMEVLTISLISDQCVPETLKPVDLQKLLAIAQASRPLLGKLIGQVLRHPRLIAKK